MELRNGALDETFPFALFFFLCLHSRVVEKVYNTRGEIKGEGNGFPNVRKMVKCENGTLSGEQLLQFDIFMLIIPRVVPCLPKRLLKRVYTCAVIMQVETMEDFKFAFLLSMKGGIFGVDRLAGRKRPICMMLEEKKQQQVSFCFSSGIGANGSS